jgi:hypothetical protein
MARRKILMSNDCEGGIFLSEFDWQEICERGKLFCPMCGEHPAVDDIATFVDEGICSFCAVTLARWLRD